MEEKDKEKERERERESVCVCACVCVCVCVACVRVRVRRCDFTKRTARSSAVMAPSMPWHVSVRRISGNNTNEVVQVKTETPEDCVRKDG